MTQTALASHATKRNNPYLTKTDQTHLKKKALGDVKIVGPKPINMPTLARSAKSGAAGPIASVEEGTLAGVTKPLDQAQLQQLLPRLPQRPKLRQRPRLLLRGKLLVVRALQP